MQGANFVAVRVTQEAGPEFMIGHFRRQLRWALLGRAWPGSTGLRTQTTPGGHRFDEAQQRTAAAWLAGL